jgi:transmembrane sensor
MERFRYLFSRYVGKIATVAERLEFQEMLQLQEYDVELKSLIDSYFSDFVALEHEPTFDSADEILRTVFSTNEPIAAIKQRTGIKKLWPRIAAVASIVLVVSVGGYFYYNPSLSKIRQTTTDVADIAPGKMGATLTLANGKKIRLSAAAKGQLAREAGVAISKSADGQVIYEVKDLPVGTEESNVGAINTLTTAKGETYQVLLRDGTKVWLNAASSLSYTTALSEQGKRKVALEGEAYFQVAKDKKHPFLVESKGQEVEVLGTHFNINSYADEASIKTTLLEGSVRISLLSLRESAIPDSKSGMANVPQHEVVLKPGQQSIVVGNGRIKVSEVDTEEAVLWKEGKFSFSSEELSSIMRKVARWYNVEVVYGASVDQQTTFSGSVSRFESVSGVLRMLKKTSDLNFRIADRKVYVTKQ